MTDETAPPPAAPGMWDRTVQTANNIYDDPTGFAKKLAGHYADALVNWGTYPGKVMQSPTATTTEDMVPWSAGTAMQGLTGALPRGGVPGTGVFIGPAGWNKIRGNKPPLEDVVKSPLSPDERFFLTGTSVGREGIPRQELPDLNAKLVQVRGDAGPDAAFFKLDHPKADLHDMYNIPPIIAHQHPEVSPSVYGWAQPETSQIVLNSHPNEIAAGAPIVRPGNSQGYSPMSMTLHEIQHIIQNKEGFEPGFSPNLAPFTKEYWNILGKDTPKDKAGWLAANKNIYTGAATPEEMRAAAQVYARTSGEVEARNVQNRFDNPVSYAYHPSRSEDVAAKQQLPIGNILKALYASNMFK